MKKTYKKFLSLVEKECEKHGVKLEIRDVKYVISNNLRCAGYFEGGDNPKLIVAAGCKNAPSVLAHEYCHLTQWVDGIDLWKKSDKSLDVVDRWLNGEKVRNIEKHLAVCRDMELDNEKRTAKLVKKYDLGISVKKYTRKANAYVHLYNWMLYSKRWTRSNNPATGNKRLLEVMSKKFDMDYDILEPHIYEIFKEEKI